MEVKTKKKVVVSDNANNKKGIRIQLHITEKMDDDIANISDLMGLAKQEFVRMAVAHYVAQWKTSINMVGGVMETNPHMKAALDSLRGN